MTENWKWAHGSFEEKQKILFKYLKFSFTHIIDDEQVNRTLSVFGRLDYNYNEFRPILEGNEFLLTGSNLRNNLIIKMIRYQFPISHIISFEERTKTISQYYPRLKYVLLLNEKSINYTALKTCINFIFLKDYPKASGVVKSLTKFTIKPEEVIGITVAGQGENI